MADVLNTSPSFSSGAGSYSLSPSNYEMGRADYEEEGIKRAFIDLLKLTIPITITSLFVSLLLAANLIWIGHHSSQDQFAGAALGNMIVNIMGNSIIIGMTSGLDTQCGQAFGARLYKMMGVLMQRSICISHVVMIIVAGVFWFADDLLIIAGQNKDAAEEAGKFIRIFIASLWPIAMFANLRRYLQAQRQVVFIPVAVLIGLISQIIALLILVNILDMGFIGACIALPCSYWSMTGSLYMFTRCNKPLQRAVKATWPGWGSWALQDWGIFLKLSIPGTFQLCAEWWALEVMALFAGHFGKEYVSAFTVTLNAIGVFARLPLGISFSAAVLVGNKLGAARPVSAKIIYDCSVALSIVSGLILGASLWLFRDFFATIYCGSTHDADVKPIVSDALPFCAVYFVFYAYQRASAGGARGMGRQNIGAAIYILAYYFIGMPIGIWFAYDGLPGRDDPLYIKGLWAGASLSAMMGSFFFLFFRFWVNWDHESERAQQRIEDEHERIRAFKEDVQSKFGNMMSVCEFDELLDGETNIDDESHIEKLGKFRLDNDANEMIYDEPEPNWNDDRGPQLKYHTGYNAPEQSHKTGSFPSRALQQPIQPSINRNDPNLLQSIDGPSINYVDTSLQSDVMAKSLQNSIRSSESGKNDKNNNK